MKLNHKITKLNYKITILCFILLSCLPSSIFAQPDSIPYMSEMMLIDDRIYDFEGEFSEEGLQAVRKNGKWGYLNTNFKEEIPFIYDNAGDFSEGLAEVQKDGRWGFIDTKGKTVIPFIYDDAHRFSGGLASVKSGRKWGFIDVKGGLAIPMEYDDVYTFAEGKAAASLNEHWGHIDKTGKIITPIAYDYVEDFEKNLAVVENMGKMGMVNEKGELIIPTNYDKLQLADSLNIKALTKGKWGVLDKTGKEIVPFLYDRIEPLFFGGEEFMYEVSVKDLPFEHYLVSVQEKAGVVTKEGKLLIPPIYVYVNKNGDFWEITDSESLIGFTDANGNVLVAPKYSGTQYFTNEMLPVRLDKSWGILDKNAREVIPPRYEDIMGYSEGFFAVKSGDLWGYIDKDENIKIPFLFEEVRDFQGGFAVVRKGNHFGVIDKQGKLGIPLKYNYIAPIQDTKYAICRKYVDENAETGEVTSKQRLVNMVTGKQIGKEYNEMSLSEFGEVLFLGLSGKEGAMDTKGTIVIPVKYELVYSAGIEGLFWVSEKGLLGLMDKKRSWVIKPQYEEAQSFYDGAAEVTKNGKPIFINIKGEKVEHKPTKRQIYGI